MGGNIPGRNFPVANYPGGNLPGRSFIGGSSPGGNFPSGSFLETKQNICEEFSSVHSFCV